MMDDGAGCKVFIHNRPIDFKSVSPIFGRVSKDLFKHHEDLWSEDFAPARDLANMLSVLEKTEASDRAFLENGHLNCFQI
jgi:hypothetical protein